MEPLTPPETSGLESLSRDDRIGYRFYEEPIKNLLAAIDQGTCPWHNPCLTLPIANASSGYSYRGINRFNLALATMAHGYRSPYWLSLKQANDFGGRVKKGSRSTIIVFRKLFDRNREAVDSETGAASDASHDNRRAGSLLHPPTEVVRLFEAQPIGRPITVSHGRQGQMEPIDAPVRISAGCVGDRKCEAGIVPRAGALVDGGQKVLDWLLVETVADPVVPAQTFEAGGFWRCEGFHTPDCGKGFSRGRSSGFARAVRSAAGPASPTRLEEKAETPVLRSIDEPATEGTVPAHEF